MENEPLGESSMLDGTLTSWFSPDSLPLVSRVSAGVFDVLTERALEDQGDL